MKKRRFFKKLAKNVWLFAKIEWLLAKTVRIFPVKLYRHRAIYLQKVKFVGLLVIYMQSAGL
jgi:hypothetical protein